MPAVRVNQNTSQNKIDLANLKDSKYSLPLVRSYN